jgi:hypothetical protein
MRMQEPEPWQSCETPAIADQEYGAYRAESERNAQEQKIYPQQTREARVSALNILTIVLSSIVALLLFVTIFVLSLVSAVRRAVRYQRLRFR